jgi:hypothetical protein
VFQTGVLKAEPAAPFVDARGTPLLDAGGKRLTKCNATIIGRSSADNWRSSCRVLLLHPSGEPPVKWIERDMGVVFQVGRWKPLL